MTPVEHPVRLLSILSLYSLNDQKSNFCQIIYDYYVRTCMCICIALSINYLMFLCVSCHVVQSCLLVFVSVPVFNGP